MKHDIIYKSTKYLLLWGVLFFIIRVTTKGELDSIDVALTAAVITLLVCVMENMYCNISSLSAVNKRIDGFNVTPNTNPNPNPNHSNGTNGINEHTNTPVSHNDNSNLMSDVSSMASASSGSSVSSVSSMSSASSDVSNMSDVSGINPNDTYQQYTSPQFPSTVIMKENYLGDKALFEPAAFGGTKDGNVNINDGSTHGSFSNLDTGNVNNTNTNTNDKNKNDNNKIIGIDNTIIDGSQYMNKKMNDVPNQGLQWYEQAFNPRSYAGAENLDQIAVKGGKTRNDLLVNQMIYSDFNRLPPSFNDNDFEYGYSFLPPKDWYPLPPYPPVCVSNANTPVQPVYTDNTTMDLKDWHETQKITPPDSMNTAYITNEMNSKV